MLATSIERKPELDVHEQLLHDLENLDLEKSPAQEVLDKGLPVYLFEDDTPEDLLVKEYPDGRRELVRFSRQGDEVIRVL